MKPDDERHGTNAGYIAGCREECCRAASLRYSKRLKVDRNRGIRRSVPSWRAVRRLDALACLGWSRGAIADEMGVKHRVQIYAIGQHPSVYTSTLERLDEVYQRLSMTLPTATTTAQKVGITKTRNNARRRGALPPLAWDDIDDEHERPVMRLDSTLYRSAELVAEWDHLRAGGESIEQAACQLGVGVDAIEKAIERTARERVAA